MSPGPLPLPTPDRLVFAERARLGIQFTERMSGYLVEVPTDPSTDPNEACRPAAERERSNGWRIECTLTVLSEDLERILMDPDHEAMLVGTVTVNAPGFPKASMTVKDGRLHLFRVDPDRVETRRLEYEMEFTGGGSTYRLRGFKEVRNALPWKAWADLSTCFFGLSGPAESGRYYWGVLTLSVADFVRQLATIRVRHAQRWTERVDGTVGFVGSFARRVLQSYGRVVAPSVIATLDPPREKMRPVKVTVDRMIRVPTSDGVPIRLTSYNQAPGNPPVILVPGFTTTASSFATPTVETNLVEYLCKKGKFNVWLLDYRASPAYAPAWSSFTLDDIAARDYPAAVRQVLEETGVQKVQIVAHCVGSISLAMALLAGYLKKDELKSVICSQVAAHVVTAEATQFKVGLGLTALMRLFGVRRLTATFNPRSWGNWLMDQLLKLYPTRERCNNPVCRRLLFIFHEIYRHEQLNAATHDALRQWFGICSMQALRHLSRMVRAGHVVDAEGRDVYLTASNLKRLEGLPISFMHGRRNHAFDQPSTQATYDALRDANRTTDYRRHVFDDYAHMDCFIGKRAAKPGQVFPWILDELRRHQR